MTKKVIWQICVKIGQAILAILAGYLGGSAAV